MKKNFTIEVKRPEELSDSDFKLMYELYLRYYNNTPYDIFYNDIQAIHHLFLVKSDKDHQIIGFICRREYEYQYGNKIIKVFLGGKTIIEESYWGSRVTGTLFNKWLVDVVLYHLRHPSTPTFIYQCPTGYKTYLLLAKNAFQYWPHYHKENKNLKDIALYVTHKLYGNQFDSHTGLVDFSKHYALKHEKTLITEEVRKANPLIDYFAKINPEWSDGKGVPMIVKVSFINLVYAYAKFAMRALKFFNGGHHAQYRKM